MGNFFSELKRRNIFRVAGVYAVVGWLLAQMASVLETAMNMPGWFDTMVISLLMLGFPIALILAWAFEMTPEGVKRTESVSVGDSIAAQTGRKLDVAIIGGLVLVAALVTWQTTRPSELSTPISQINTTQSIAVLPFENFSTDADQDYFASGISEELLNALAKIDGLKVSSRTSAFAFKGQEKPIAEIAKALNVAHILEGSVRKSGNTLRITAQLIDTKTDVHLWSETYDRALTADNIFKIQDEITAAIVRELQGEMNFVLTPDNTARTTSIEAFELYLRARDNMEKRKPDTLNAAVDGFKQVIALDPEFAPTYAGLAETYMLMSVYADMPYLDTITFAQPLVDKGLALAPNSAETLTAAASLALRISSSTEVIDLTNEAIAINPNFALAYHRKASALLALKQPKKALDIYQKALELDPLSAVLLANITYTQIDLGDIDGARATAQDNIEWNPDTTFGYEVLGEISNLAGEYATAHSYYKDAQARNPDKASLQFSLIDMYTSTGFYEEAAAAANKPYIKAYAHFKSGSPEKARPFLDAMVPTERGFALYLLREDYDKSMSLIEPWITKLYAEDTVDTEEDIYYTAEIAHIMKLVGHPRSKEFMGRVRTFFQGKKPIEFDSPDAIYGGAAMQMLEGEPDYAFTWLNRLFDLDAAHDELFIPIFDPIRDTPEFKALEKRFKERYAPHRAAIEEQLANPKPEWLKSSVDGKDGE